MNLVRTLSLAVALSAVVVSSPPHSEERQPQTAPTRDVDIMYQITRPGQPMILERRRWLSSQHLRRVDGPDKSATIFDQSRGELTILNAANHTYLTLEGPAAKRMSPGKVTVLKRGSEFKIRWAHVHRLVMDRGRYRNAHRLFDGGRGPASAHH